MSGHGIVGVPRVPAGMVLRESLLDRIGRTPLTIVRGPGGRGKTVLLAQWASRHPGSGAWVTVEQDLGSRFSFWTSVIEAIAHLGRDIRPPLEDGADRDSLRNAVLRAFHAIEQPLVLVIDDAHELQDPLIAEDLLTVVRSCRNVTAIVGTRTYSRLEAPREALILDITVIQPDEMILSEEEVQAIVGDAGSPYGSAAELLAASGGSPLLLRAILAGTPTGDGTPEPARAVIADYLKGSFEKQSELEPFASMTSIPDDIDVAGARTLSGLPEERVESLLITLEADGLVMRREASDAIRYRYHPLVREVLREELRRRHPEHFRRASLLASADAESRKRYLSALRHAVDAEDYTRASDVCLHGGFALLRARGAAAILQAVPLRYVARLPFLAVVLGLAANARGERLRALELLTLALGASRAWRRSQRVAERVGLALVEAVVLRITGRAGESVVAARRMLSLIEEAAPGDLEEIDEQLGAIRYQGALSLFRAGRIKEAQAAAERVGISAHALANGEPESLGAASLVAVAEAARGDGVMAGETLARIDAGNYAPELRSAYVGSLASLARGILALESGDTEAAAAEADAFERHPNLEFAMLFTSLRSFIDLWRGESDRGLRALDQREDADRQRGRASAQDRQVGTATRVLLHAALGQAGRAHAALRGLDRKEPLHAVLQATLYLQEQRHGSAVERLASPTDGHGPRLRAAAELLTAVASLADGDTDLAEVSARRFLATSAVHGIVSPVLLIPADHRDALWALLSEINVDESLLAALRNVPAPLRIGSERIALTPRELEVLEQLRETGSLAEIAAKLSVSANTVKSQARTLYRKLGVASRDEALRVANLQGFLSD